MIEISGIPMSLDAMLTQNAALQHHELAQALGVRKDELLSQHLVRKSVDARKKSNVHFTTTFVCELSEGIEQRLLEDPPRGLHVKRAKPYIDIDYPQLHHSAAARKRIVVVGLGPAGLFCALYLARCGLKPLVIERGFDVDRRARDVAQFEKTGQLNPHSNIQFGEGGAGAFSDGKLTTNVKNPHTQQALHWFVDAGAPEEILVEAHPHIGSDKLPAVVRRMREEICARGGEVCFGTCLVDWIFADGHVTSVIVEQVETGARKQLAADAVVLSCGHSARDVFELCKVSDLAMEQKPFAVGVRIEHLQRDINFAQWGAAAAHPALGAAEYKLVVHLPQGRSVYTFCMCPGGSVVAAASELGGVVTNGMSNYMRSGKNANAALLVGVGPNDFGSDDVLAGVAFQRAIEQAAFDLGKRHNAKPYQAPCQSVGDFLADAQRREVSDHSSRLTHANIRATTHASMPVFPTYTRGVFSASLVDCLPDFVVDSLAQALPMMGKKLKGFDSLQAIMTAPETRSSSPVRIKRARTLQAYAASNDPDSAVATGVFPCGEGPGYAGGIMSAACDGIRVAQGVIRALS